MKRAERAAERQRRSEQLQADLRIADDQTSAEFTGRFVVRLLPMMTSQFVAWGTGIVAVMQVLRHRRRGIRGLLQLRSPRVFVMLIMLATLQAELLRRWLIRYADHLHQQIEDQQRGGPSGA
ncbi:hypothetical protein FOE78_22235 [Microlunatus elymi]|uniref:Uncharacterized protein n=1 Tax=Microlunatus elymi TaxID=2596828 RepID=A0A516Q4W4_9ACTN|nr:hypothetical protein [Microlunatus elymi]QDP98261.1 hypothetical protein FOE78_22235 [Microlunatus elymi]